MKTLKYFHNLELSYTLQQIEALAHCEHYNQFSWWCLLP